MSTSVQDGRKSDDIAVLDETSNAAGTGARHVAVKPANRFLQAIYNKLDVVALAYLIVPLFLFLAGSFDPIPAVVLTALAAVASYPLFRSAWSKPPRGKLTMSLILVAAGIVTVWSLLGGSGHLFFANSDWIKHDAVYADLSRMSWPPTYLQSEDGSLVMRYYEAFYLVPAALVKLVGGHHNLIMQAWVTVGAFLVVLRVLAVVPRLAMQLTVLGAFIIFGGLDLIGWLVVQGADTLSIKQQVDGWNLQQSPEGFAMVQFPSMTTLLFWVPQHGLSGWIATLILLERKDDRRLILGLPILIVSVAFWSAFCAIGLVPFAAVAYWRYIKANNLRSVISPAVISAVVVGLVVAAFLLSGSAENQHGFIWELTPAPYAIFRAVLFLVLEIGLLLLAMRIAGIRLNVWHKTAVVFLIPLSLYVFGAWGDLTMRASIPALFILFLALRDWMAEREPSLRPARKTIPLLIVLALGSYAAVPQFVGAIALPADRQPRDEIGDVVEMLAVAPPDIPAAQYLVAGPPLLGSIMRDHDPLYSRSDLPASLEPEDWTLGSDNGFTGGTLDQSEAGGLLIRMDGAADLDINSKSRLSEGMYELEMQACLTGTRVGEERLIFGLGNDVSRRPIPINANGCFAAEFFARVEANNGTYMFLSPRGFSPDSELSVDVLRIDSIMKNEVISN